MKKLLCLIFLFLASAATAQAACTGSSPNWTAPTWADVAACHAAASNGDTITVTAGSYTVTTNTVITKYVKIHCATIRACTITDNTADASDLINITESTAGHSRLEGFAFVMGTADHTNPNGVIVMTYASGGLGILISENSYTNGSSSGDFIIAKVNQGVIWNNSATATPINPNCYNNASFVRHYSVGLTGPWTHGPYYGMADSGGDKNLYIEHNTITNVFEGIDTYENARTVIRYNTITNSGTINHGADTGNLAARHLDIYGNTFVWDTTSLTCAGDPPGVNSFIYLRGGPALIHDNTIPDLISMAWGDKQEISFTDEKLRRNAGPYACWAGGYPSPYQVGWGYSTGATQAGTSGVFQDLEPVYLWNNTGGGNYGSPSIPDPYAECGGGAPSSSTYIQSGREYYLNTAKPGYTPYTYPHPLATNFAAKTIYVNKSGNNGNSCANAELTTDSLAKLTIASGISCLVGGDTLIIGDGTYDEFIQTTIPGGSVGAHTIVKAENARQAILFPQSLGGTGSSVIWIDEDYITIDGLVVDATYVQDNGGYYVHNYPADNVGNVTIQNGVVKNGITPASVPTSDPNGILLDQGVNLIVRNMEITNFRGHGIYNPSTGALIENNYIHDWHPQAVITGYCMQDYNPVNPPTGTIYRGNTCSNWQNGLVISDPAGAEIYNNIFSGITSSDGLKLRYGSANAKVYFNTFYNNLVGLHMYSDSSGTIAKDNIFYANINGPILDEAADSVCTYNLGVTGGESSSDSCSSTATASNPLFKNSALGDFHTEAGSPALGAGIAIPGILYDKDKISRPDPPAMGPYEIPSGAAPEDPIDEDFESYTAAQSICGANGGAGWTQSWTCPTGVATVETAPMGMTGKALRLNSTSDVTLRRLFTAHTGAFTISFTMRLSTTSPNQDLGVNLINAAGIDQTYAYFDDTTGNIKSVSQTLLASYAADTNYAIDVDFDTAVHPNESRARVNGGTYSSWEACISDCASIAGIDVLTFASNAHIFWVDDITENAGSGTITNVTPNAGQVCTSGSACPISWGSNGITGAVNVYYLVGGNQYLIASPDVTATPYTWTVNAPAGTTIKTRVSQGAVSSDSGEFTVRGTKVVFAQ